MRLTVEHDAGVLLIGSRIIAMSHESAGAWAPTATSRSLSAGMWRRWAADTQLARAIGFLNKLAS
jgi:hypothetical protein